MDDSAGRVAAANLGIRTTGTIGVLRAASIARLAKLPLTLARLAATNFRISRTIVDQMLAEDAAREDKKIQQLRHSDQLTLR